MGVAVSGLETARKTLPQLAVRAALARGYRWLRHVPERLGHSSYRARAIASLSTGQAPQRVLYICLGNVCRSPYAEAASRRDAALWSSPAPAWSSAGFIGPNRPPPPLAMQVATARGAPLDTHRSRLVTRELVLESDLIVVMEAYQAEELATRYGRRRGVVVLGDLDPKWLSTRTIPDPWDKAHQDFVASYERIDRCLAALAASIIAPAS